MWEKTNSHSGMYDTCHTIMWLRSALESTGFTWVASPAFSSVSSSSPSPEERTQRVKTIGKKMLWNTLKEPIPLLESQQSDNRHCELRSFSAPGEHLQQPHSFLKLDFMDGTN